MASLIVSWVTRSLLATVYFCVCLTGAVDAWNDCTYEDTSLVFIRTTSTLQCPRPFVDPSDAIMCCGTKKNRFCCKPEELNVALLAGLLSGGLLLFIIGILICCCCCSCCLLAQKRQKTAVPQRITVVNQGQYPATAMQGHQQGYVIQQAPQQGYVMQQSTPVHTYPPYQPSPGQPMGPGYQPVPGYPMGSQMPPPPGFKDQPPAYTN